ncbi:MULTISPECIES: hypothetical protein [unclassified Streptomyces]|uniref:hypothetical protein n=1 Tax=unclassified Streptomyces TaxID=2593676 RepID=UPI00382233FA
MPLGLDFEVAEPPEPTDRIRAVRDRLRRALGRRAVRDRARGRVVGLSSEVSSDDGLCGGIVNSPGRRITSEDLRITL